MREQLPRAVPQALRRRQGRHPADWTTEDVLESGIEIVARPPGKELRSLTLLSGGEKTMTALALLFSIFQHAGPARSACWTRWTPPWTRPTPSASTSSSASSSRHSQFIIISPRQADDGHGRRALRRDDAGAGRLQPHLRPLRGRRTPNAPPRPSSSKRPRKRSAGSQKTNNSRFIPHCLIPSDGYNAHLIRLRHAGKVSAWRSAVGTTEEAAAVPVRRPAAEDRRGPRAA